MFNEKAKTHYYTIKVYKGTEIQLLVEMEEFFKLVEFLQKVSPFAVEYPRYSHCTVSIEKSFTLLSDEMSVCIESFGVDNIERVKDALFKG